MDQSLKQIYTVFLRCRGWIGRHEILLNNDGWIEEHCVVTEDIDHSEFEIKFVVNATGGHIEVLGITLSKPRIDDYKLYMSYA